MPLGAEKKSVGETLKKNKMVLEKSIKKISANKAIVHKLVYLKAILNKLSISALFFLLISILYYGVIAHVFYDG